MEKMEANGFTTLNQARSWLKARLRKQAVCPCCEQVAKVYTRNLEGAMVAFLLRAYRVKGTEWFHVPTFMQVDVLARKACGVGGTYSKLAYWGFLEELQEKRPDGGRAGWWRVTDLGEKFINGEVTATKYIMIYASRFLGFEGEEITLQQALGKKFDYEELMNS